MTSPRLPERDRGEVDALVADRYLDALLAAGDRHAHDTPADTALDPDLREAARVLRRSLVRVHPSFRFEERLAERLAGLAAVRAGPAALAAGGGTVVPFRGDVPVAVDPLLPSILAGDLDPTDAVALDRAAGGADRRPLLVGGALTSAALSLVGVAWVAWRASRPGSRSPAASTMTRAARTAHARRAAAQLAGALTGRPA